MKIAIFETEHFEAAYPLVRLFDDGQHEITIFSYPAARQQLEYMLGEKSSRYDWISPKEGQSARSFIRTMQAEIKKKGIELLYLNTVSDNYFFYALLAYRLPRVRVILTIHAINSFFETRKKYGLRKLSHAIGKSLLRTVIKEYNVLSQSMVPVLQQKSGENKKVHNIPGGVYEGRKTHTSLQLPIHIVIPGSVDSKRRNYDQVFELLALLQKEIIPVKMTFLGPVSAESASIKKRISEWNTQHHNLISYDNKLIVQAEFDAVIQSADFLFNPSVVNTLIEDGVKETYGLTISSGNISDAIRHAKPIILPYTLTVDPYFEKACIHYKTIEDIAAFLKSIIQTPETYLQLTQSAMEAAQEYTVEKIRSRSTI